MLTYMSYTLKSFSAWAELHSDVTDTSLLLKYWSLEHEDILEFI